MVTYINKPLMFIEYKYTINVTLSIYALFISLLYSQENKKYQKINTDYYFYSIMIFYQ